MRGSLTSLTKKQTKSSKKNSAYPTYVGDLPVKIIQDIIDSFGLVGDWPALAGRTGISEKQVRLLKSKYKDNATEIARVVFDQWLCRVPKPKDLAYLLIYVERPKDAVKLQKFIDPQEWKDIEKRISRFKGTSASRSTITDPIIETEYEDSQVHHQITSEEESTVNRFMTTSPPPRRPPTNFNAPSAITLTSATSGRSRQSEITPRSVSDRSTDSESILTLGPEIPLVNQHCSVGNTPSPTIESEIAQLLKRCMKFEFPIPPNLSDQITIHRCFILNQGWAIKDFSNKDPRLLYNEVSALNSLRHPNIIPLAGYYRIPEFDYPVQHLVYPYMENRDLECFMKENPAARSIRLRLDILCSIGKALSYIHYKSYIHGDLKMTNILIDRYQRPYLCDFESSVRIDEIEHFDQIRREKQVVCTPPFFPSHGNVSRYERDLYAFGIVLAYVFTMRYPVENHINMDGESLINELLGSLVNDIDGMRPYIHDLCLKCVQCIELNNLKNHLMKDKDAFIIVEIVKELEKINGIQTESFWSDDVEIQRKGSSNEEDFPTDDEDSQ